MTKSLSLDAFLAGLPSFGDAEDARRRSPVALKDGSHGRRKRIREEWKERCMERELNLFSSRFE
jgi:hypothetical protein